MVPRVRETRPVARGGQDARIPQPRDHSLADPRIVIIAESSSNDESRSCLASADFRGHKFMAWRKWPVQFIHICKWWVGCVNSAFFTQPLIERSGTPYPEKERERERARGRNGKFYRATSQDSTLHKKWRETKQQLIWWPDLALLGCSAAA